MELKTDLDDGHGRGRKRQSKGRGARATGGCLGQSGETTSCLFLGEELMGGLNEAGGAGPAHGGLRI